MKRALLLLVPVLLAIVAWASLPSSGPSADSSSVALPSVATFSPAGEPGSPFVVSGRVWDESGTRSVAGVKLYAYHTDAKGVYNAQGSNGNPRLKGTIVTDAEGRFEWRTIRPMPYPGGGNPAHIHIQASGGGYPEQWVNDLLFSDDPYLSAKDKEASQAKGKFNPIVTPARDAKGVLRTTFNIRLSKNPPRH